MINDMSGLVESARYRRLPTSPWKSYFLLSSGLACVGGVDRISVAMGDMAGLALVWPYF